MMERATLAVCSKVCWNARALRSFVSLDLGSIAGRGEVAPGSMHRQQVQRRQWRPKPCGPTAAGGPAERPSRPESRRPAAAAPHSPTAAPCVGPAPKMQLFFSVLTFSDSRMLQTLQGFYQVSLFPHLSQSQDILSVSLPEESQCGKAHVNLYCTSPSIQSTS